MDQSVQERQAVVWIDLGAFGEGSSLANVVETLRIVTRDAGSD